MTLSPTANVLEWEAPLLARAYQGWYASTAQPAHFEPESMALGGAYSQCAELTKAASHTFYLASGLLPPPKRRAIRALYAFCRTSDDIVDSTSSNAGEALLEWQRRALASPIACAEDPVAYAWADTRIRFGIPSAYAEQLIHGVARDLFQDRYETFEDLAAYCYDVASTVGLMSMYIIGSEGERAIPYAVELGVALQLTNILRDVGEDWRAGRLYLPLDELARFGLSERSVAQCNVDQHWREFMRFQIARARTMYEQASAGIPLLHPDGQFSVAAAAALYAAILDDIEDHDYNVFSRRAHVSAFGKLRRLAGLRYRWW